MLTAILLMQVKPELVDQVAVAVADIEGVSEVYSVTGDWDLVCIVRVKKSERLADVVTGHVCKIEGIQRTHTMLAFRAYGKADLAYLFA